MKNAISGTIDTPFDDIDMDYWGGDLPEPC